ncbi:Periplasmic serine endoprotease DegP [Candidatus Erwinia haradaeae]|uniref:Probable periplasmic serine endoprotease DegP-like n=1 Tax=Candidatus Erwinia haradaeae TaxID=1922217 RepID=A0A451DL89_9GAMM|nr:serine endoprotease DegP [Candidatus Erwinia haradaeae]VFP87485.1 Periplasmic serine endoprotease DegP [Candidatus Erwinia haradaeae]
MKKKILLLHTLVVGLNLVLPVLAATDNPKNLWHSVNSVQLTSLAPMLEKVMPSVVSVNIEGTMMRKVEPMQQFQPFFGGPSPLCQEGSPFLGSPLCPGNNSNDNYSIEIPPQKFRSLGSGVVIDSIKGYIVTNNHVLDNATRIQVQLSGGEKYDAKVIGKDPRSDIALIQIRGAKNLTAITIADSDGLHVGDYTVAIGNPYGLGETATSGIISALGRSGLNTENYENFIQTDAAINRGNSGGALVNINGELIGINTAILAPDGGNIGIGFAIPSNMVKNLCNQMIAYGQVKRGELGIIGTELNSELAKAIKVNVQRGAFVSQVLSQSSADRAGIHAGDVIILINNKSISSFAALRAQIGSLPVGTTIELGLIRNGKLIKINLALQESNTERVSSGSIYDGIEGADLRNYNTKDIKGVQVETLKSGSAAARIGLKRNDVILGVNQQPITNITELKKALDNKPTVLALSIKRGDNLIYLLMQ